MKSGNPDIKEIREGNGLSLGGLRLPSRLMLAPLAGISDPPFRMINRSFGCCFAFTEMISARALVYANRNTLDMLASSPEDAPLGVQLLGAEPGIIRRALDIISSYGFSLVDLNAACPVNKVTARGEGSALLKDPAGLGELLKTMVAASPLPVTVKIRSGWDDRSVNAREIALRARDAGVSGIFVHGRTRAQGYSGRVDYDAIREVKESVDVPVVASGDALSPALVRRLMDLTGCDGVTIARGALGNPWIFPETEAFLRDGRLQARPTPEETSDTMSAHFDACLSFYGERQGVLVFRKFFAWYIKGFHGCRDLKEEAFRAASPAQMRSIIADARSLRRKKNEVDDNW